jgi:TIR domain
MNEAKKRPFVFLSYAHADKPFVTRLITDLEANDIPVWIDHEGISPGSSDWEQDIRNAVNAASAIILIASPQARSSHVVRDELAVAKRYKRPIYPLGPLGHIGLMQFRLGGDTHSILMLVIQHTKQLFLNLLCL